MGDGPPYIKFSGAVRYKVSDLDAFFQKRLVKHTTEWSANKMEEARRRR